MFYLTHFGGGFFCLEIQVKKSVVKNICTFVHLKIVERGKEVHEWITYHFCRIAVVVANRSTKH